MAYIPGRKKSRPEKPSDRGEGPKEPPKEERSDLDLLKLKKAYRDLEEAHRQIRESHIEMIFNLAIAAEYKDPDTGNHILRISDYATELAKSLRLPQDEIDTLRYASPMHDIGKIGIPDHILKKPGKLTAAEWEVMKQHTVIGSRIFQNSKSPLLKAIAEISITHHERFDGSGYPGGLKGKKIPLFGRIVAVADVFDAVISKRCYKEEWSFKEGFDYVKSLAGTHLDPELVEVFVGIHENIRGIYDANKAIQHFLGEFKDQTAV